MSISNNEKHIFFDMDGVLTEYRVYCTLRDMAQEGYFETLKPEWNVILAFQKLCEYIEAHRDTAIRVYVLTKVFPSYLPYSLEEKRRWKNKFMPYLKDANFIMVNGDEKEKSQAIKDQLGIDIDENCFLIDDFNPNLEEWRRQGGTPIKYVNGVNDKNMSFVGDRLLYTESPDELKDSIFDIIFPNT